MTITKEKVALLLVLAAIVTNPLTGQYVQLGIELLFTEFFRIGAWVSLVSGIYVCGLMGWHIWSTRDRVNIPKGAGKRAGSYIATPR